MDVQQMILLNLLQMILYDTPGVLQKEMHLLDSMMMKNVRSAAVNADCVLVLVDARKTPEKVWTFIFLYKIVCSTFFLVFPNCFLSLD